MYYTLYEFLVKLLDISWNVFYANLLYVEPLNTKRMNSNEKDSQIYLACERVRIYAFLKSGVSNKNHTPEELPSIHKGSLIDSLIQSFQWSILFATKDWLKVLSFVVNLECIFEDTDVRNSLRLLKEYFPEETKLSIVMI